MELSPEVIAEINADRKISAIKLLREQQGIGLKEAKEIVDAYTERRQPRARSRASRSDGGMGRLLLVAVVAAIVYGLYRYFG